MLGGRVVRGGEADAVGLADKHHDRTTIDSCDCCADEYCVLDRGAGAFLM